SIDGMYPSYKLNASVDAVRAAWALGRAHAIEEGRPYRFAVAPGGGKYRLCPDDSSADGAPPSNGDAGGHSLTLDEELPQGVTFGIGDDDGQAAQGSQSTDGLTTVAVFLPDGTARDDAEVRFQAKGALSKSVKLRGLTGAVTVQQQSQDGGGKR